jgi:hypothetical protein
MVFNAIFNNISVEKKKTLDILQIKNYNMHYFEFTGAS